MAMTVCPECKNSVSSKAPLCPNCGFEVAEWFKMNFEICPACNTIIKKEKDKMAFCPKCKKNTFQVQADLIHQVMVETASKQREEALNAGKLKEFPWKEKTISIYTKIFDDYRVYNKVNTFIEKMKKIQEWLQYETNTDIEIFKKRYQDKNSGAKTISDCYNMIAETFRDRATKRCQDIAKKINEAIPNQNIIKMSDVADCYENYQDKLQIRMCLEELISIDHQVEQQLEANKIYRDIKKANRGRFVGGGFGVKGALKGAITAGIANAAYGGLYGFKNSVKNAMDEASASTGTTRHLHQADFENNLYNVLRNDLNYFIPVVADLANYVLEQCFPEEMENFEYLQEKYSNLDQKIEKDLKEINIQTAQECLQKYPFHSKVYEYVLKEFGDEHKEIEDIGNFCGVNIQVIKENLLIEKARIRTEKTTISKISEYKIYLGLPIDEQEISEQFIKTDDNQVIDGNNPKSILLAIKKLKALDTEKIIEKHETIKRYEDLIITWADGKSPKHIISAIEDLKTLDTPETKDIINKYMEQAIAWANGKNLKCIISTIEDLKTLDTPEAKNIIYKYEKRYLDALYEEKKDIIIEEGLIDNTHFSLEFKRTEIKKEAQILKECYQSCKWNKLENITDLIKKVSNQNMYHETDQSIQEIQKYIENREEYESLFVDGLMWNMKYKELQIEKKQLQKKVKIFYIIGFFIIFSLPIINHFFNFYCSMIIFILLVLIGCILLLHKRKKLIIQQKTENDIYQNYIQIVNKSNDLFNKNNMSEIEKKGFPVPKLKKQLPNIIQFTTFWILQLTDIQTDNYFFIIRQQNGVVQPIDSQNHSWKKIYNMDNDFALNLSDAPKKVSDDISIKIYLKNISKKVDIGSLWILFYGDVGDLETTEQVNNSIPINLELLENIDTNIDLWSS